MKIKERNKIKFRNFKKGKYKPNKFCKPYTLLPAYYDDLMIYLDYKLWAKYIREIISFFKIKGNKMLEIASGTGHLASLLYDDYIVTPSDNSDEMLYIMQMNYPYLNPVKLDMTNFTLKEKFNAAISFNDNVNYILSEEKLYSHFLSIFNVLEKDGVFIFDATPVYNIKKNFVKNILVKKINDVAIRWHNKLKNNSTVEAIIDVLHKKTGDIYRELHTQKIHESETIIFLLKKAGFKKIFQYDGFTLYPPKAQSEHYHFAALT